MKTDIHPKWYPDAEIVCVCGNMFKIGSTKPSLKVEICHKCHPFFTGEMKFVDRMGRVERFQTKQKDASSKIAILKERKKKKLEKEKEERKPRTLKEMLMGPA